METREFTTAAERGDSLRSVFLEKLRTVSFTLTTYRPGQSAKAVLTHLAHRSEHDLVDGEIWM